MAKSKKTGGKSLADFREAHDPTYERHEPTAVFQRELPKGARKFIVTAAQNGTPVNKDWWDVIQCIAETNKAEIIVIPLRYKNPTSHWSGSQRNAEYWDAPVRPYLWNVRHSLNKNLTLLADMKIQPTAASPLTGSDGLSLASSGIVGHTKVQLKCIPTPQSRMAKVLMTTGVCTVANYTDSRAGKIGEFHHSLAAVYVEIDGGRFFARHVHFDAKTKSATDLNWRYYAKSSRPAPRPLALIMGDTHVDFIDPSVESATFTAPDSMVNVLKPKALVWHDLNDDYSCNPHHFGNPFNVVAKRKHGRDDVHAEVLRAIEYVKKNTPAGADSYVVPSNHNDFLGRWINQNDWKRDPVNAEFYLETALAMVRGTKMGPKGTTYPDPFTYWLRREALGRLDIMALDSDESLMIGGVECGMHGHQGPNGARGSIQNLRRLGVKSIIGHSHTPGIDEGCYQVGTSTRLRLEYNHGASSWLNAHCLLHEDGKRQLIVIVDGKWRLTV
jgi:hypothetical protein